MFAGRTVTVQDARRHYGEDRFITAGHLAGRCVVLVWTPRGEARRIISMRYDVGRGDTIVAFRFGPEIPDQNRPALPFRPLLLRKKAALPWKIGPHARRQSTHARGSPGSRRVASPVRSRCRMPSFHRPICSALFW